MHTVGSFGCPLVVLGVGVVGGYAHHAALCHGLLVPLNLDGGYHCLTGKTEAAWRTMVEDIPLTVDFLDGTVGIVGGIHTYELCAVFIWHNATGVNQHAA